MCLWCISPLSLIYIIKTLYARPRKPIQTIQNTLKTDKNFWNWLMSHSFRRMTYSCVLNVLDHPDIFLKIFYYSLFFLCINQRKICKQSDFRESGKNIFFFPKINFKLSIVSFFYQKQGLAKSRISRKV